MDPRERDAKRLKDKERQELLDRAYQRVIGSKLLEKLSKQKVTTGTCLSFLISSIFIVVVVIMVSSWWNPRASR